MIVLDEMCAMWNVKCSLSEKGTFVTWRKKKLCGNLKQIHISKRIVFQKISTDQICKLGLFTNFYGTFF